MPVSIRLAIHFIFHQVLLLFMISVLAFFPAQFLSIHSPLLVMCVFFIYGAYCLCYGWYVGRPIMQLIRLIRLLASGHVLKEEDIRPNRLYREVFQQLKQLSLSLSQAEIERKALEKRQKDWMAGISHDLKTPLSYIIGYTRMLQLQQHQWSQQEQERFLQTIEEKAVHLEELIEDFTIATQQEEKTTILRLHEVNIVSFLQSLTVDMANNPVANTNPFTFHSDQETIIMLMDQQALRRIFTNLLMNAVIHNPPNTTIHVEISKISDNRVHIQIIDDGLGMDPETQQKIFDQYYRGTATHLQPQGSGLGMAIVKQLVHNLKGSISVESTPQQGSRFTLTFPLQA